MKVGFIGVGNMGGPMCRNIIRNTNHDVVVFDLNQAAIEACTALGATAGTSVAQVAADCEVVFTSLPMPRNVEEVAAGIAATAVRTLRAAYPRFDWHFRSRPWTDGLRGRYVPLADIETFRRVRGRL